MTALVVATRREMMLAAACGIVGTRAWSAPSNTVEKVAVDGFAVELTRYSAPGSGKRPTVLLLHGSKGLAARIEAYHQYAHDLAAANIDTLLFSYFQPEDLEAINQARDASTRMAQYARSADRWVSLIRAVAGFARQHERSSGHVGLLGFSLGGFVGVAAASQPLFSALTIFYAGVPDFYGPQIKFLPPLLEIHGDKDRSVSLSQGSELVALAKRLGGVAERVVFHNEGHGFDLDLGNRDAAPARRRAIDFLAHWTQQG